PESDLRCELLVYEVPVDQGPETFQEVGAGIAVVDVVGMLPYIHSQNGGLARRHGGIGIAGVHDFQRTVGVFHQPSPARTKVADGSVVELLFECIKRAECLVDRFGYGAGGCATAVGAQAVPEKGVVPDLGRVVKDRAAGALDDV